jgi:hypothetical protein
MITDIAPVSMPRFGGGARPIGATSTRFWTPIKMLVGSTALVALVSVLIITRVPGGKARVVAPPESRFDVAWADGFQTAVKAKTDREPLRNEPVTERTVRTIPIVVPPPPPPPEAARVVELPDTPPSAPPEATSRRPKYHRIQRSRGDVCARVGWRKVVTRGGKSWRCQK